MADDILAELVNVIEETEEKTVGYLGHKGGAHLTPTWVLKAAVDEIARLREERRSITTLFGKVESLEEDNARLREERLSNEERGAIRWATAALLYDADKTWPAFRERSKHSREAAETLKGLLDRQPLPPGPETQEDCDVPIQK